MVGERDAAVPTESPYRPPGGLGPQPTPPTTTSGATEASTTASATELESSGDATNAQALGDSSALFARQLVAGGWRADVCEHLWKVKLIPQITLGPCHILLP